MTGLFREHGLSLVRLAVLLTGDRATAEDVVQDAFLAFQRAQPRLRDQDKALADLRASVVNGCRSALRGRRRLQFGPNEDGPPVSSAESAVLAFRPVQATAPAGPLGPVAGTAGRSRRRRHR